MPWRNGPRVVRMPGEVVAFGGGTAGSVRKGGAMARWKKDLAERRSYQYMPDDQLRELLRHYREGEARAAANKGRRGWKVAREAIEAECLRRGLIS